MSDRPRSFWGWGYADEAISPKFVAHYKQMLQFSLGVSEFEEMEPPKIEEIDLRPPRFQLPRALSGVCTAEKFDRASHTYGKAYRDVVRGLYGQFDNPPDYVAYLKNEGELQMVMAFCAANGIALIPFGGGSSVVGGVEPPRDGGYAGVITADLRHFDQILQIDEQSRVAHVQAGLFGPALEAGLKPHGYTLRHFPQSFEFSTVGGWIVTRAGGHFATLYTHIDEFVEGVRMVTPEGIMETRRLPGSGAGPSPERLVSGSEGTLGVVTEAWLRLQHRPTYRASATVMFAGEEDGFAAVREISQSGLHPANCRLISPLEAFSNRLGDGTQTVLMLGFEAHDHDLRPWLDHGLAICEKHGGTWQADQVIVQNEGEEKKSSSSAQWKNSFLQLPYLRDLAATWGVILETFETAVTWDQFPAFHQAVIEGVTQGIKEQCGGKGMVMWRFTHVYPDGPAPYYTVAAMGERGREIEQWDGIKALASEAIIAHGGTITHHHAVGKDHRLWYTRQSDPLFTRMLVQAKKAVDPQWVLNPEVLVKRPG